MPSKYDIPTTCAFCRREFMAARPASTRPPQKYCGQRCAKDGLSRPLSEKFWSRVLPGDPSECWPWLGKPGANGYGYISHRRRRLLTHRVSWEMHNGPIPPKTEVCHACDNPRCNNPAHLFLGSHRANMRDMTDKGRNVVPALKGERHPQARLTEDQVIEIRRRIAAGDMQRRIAADFGVTRPLITAINARRIWRHLA